MALVLNMVISWGIWIVIIGTVGYFVVKKAVKDAIKELKDEEE